MTSIPSIRGVHDFAYVVADLEEAVTFFTEVLGAELRPGSGRSPTPLGPGGPPELDGLTNFETPWGQVIDVLTAPDHLPYERGTDVRLYRPLGGWSDRPWATTWSHPPGGPAARAGPPGSPA